MPSSEMWRREGLEVNDVSEKRVAFIFRVEKESASEEKC
jgi:hypothetical protein